MYANIIMHNSYSLIIHLSSQHVICLRQGIYVWQITVHTKQYLTDDQNCKRYIWDVKCKYLLKLVRGEMRALLAMRDTLLLLLTRQLYAREKKCVAILVIKLSPDINEGCKKRWIRYGTPHAEPSNRFVPRYIKCIKSSTVKVPQFWAIKRLAVGLK